MKTVAYLITAVAVSLAGTASAAPDKGNAPKNPPGKEARQSPPNQDAQPASGQDKRPNDPDQGDDNASPTAITKVCSKDTPASERSAICDDQPASP